MSKMQAFFNPKLGFIDLSKIHNQNWFCLFFMLHSCEMNVVLFIRLHSIIDWARFMKVEDLQNSYANSVTQNSAPVDKNSAPVNENTTSNILNAIVKQKHELNTSGTI